jgi:hypothetical protein
MGKLERESNFLISNQTHFFIKPKYNTIQFKSEEELIDKDTNVTEIVQEDFLCRNEISIAATIIKTVPFYQTHFCLMREYSTANLNTQTGTYYEPQKQSNFIIKKYPSNSRRQIPFTDVIYKSGLGKNPNTFLRNSLFQLKSIVETLCLLEKVGICYFDICATKIMYDIENNEVPILKITGHSFTVNTAHTFIYKIFEHPLNYINKPLEVHVMFYLIHNELDALSYSLIEVICERYANNTIFIELFSTTYRENIKNKCITYLRNYINRTKEEIIEEFSRHCVKWDSYGISILFLHILGVFCKVYKIQNSQLNKYVQFLVKNISCNPNERLTMRELYEGIIDRRNGDWNFVNYLDPEKMTNILELL